MSGIIAEDTHGVFRISNPMIATTSTPEINFQSRGLSITHGFTNCHEKKAPAAAPTT